MAWRAALGPFFQRNDTRDFLPRNRHAGFAEVFSFGCIRHTRYIPGGKSVSFRFLIFEATAACAIISGRSVPSAQYLGKFVGTIHIPILGTVRSWGSTTQPLILNEPSSATANPQVEVAVERDVGRGANEADLGRGEGAVVCQSNNRA